MMQVRERLKWLLFPGSNLHARLRYALLPGFLEHARPGETRLVLDAGCGNGMLSYASCRKGNRVLGLSIKEGEVARNRKLFNGLLRVPEDRLSFRAKNLYDVGTLGMSFDEIICSEVLEHISRDAELCRSFWNILKPGGVLHLCCPNADHPDNLHGPLDPNETGGHVRPGYTLETYRALLEPIGFRIVQNVGIGGPIRQAFNRHIIRIEERFGAVPGFLLAWFALLFVWLDPDTPRVPYSIYVRAVKGNVP
jgi:SAM-dependent methyltransferase